MLVTHQTKYVSGFSNLICFENCMLPKILYDLHVTVREDTHTNNRIGIMFVGYLVYFSRPTSCFDVNVNFISSNHHPWAKCQQYRWLQNISYISHKNINSRIVMVHQYKTIIFVFTVNSCQESSGCVSYGIMASIACFTACQIVWTSPVNCSDY